MSDIPLLDMRIFGFREVFLLILLGGIKSDRVEIFFQLNGKGADKFYK